MSCGNCVNVHEVHSGTDDAPVISITYNGVNPEPAWWQSITRILITIGGSATLESTDPAQGLIQWNEEFISPKLGRATGIGSLGEGLHDMEMTIFTADAPNGLKNWVNKLPRIEVKE